jgi:ABC-type transport system involved in cytochrome c biogenesis permease subunit
MGLALKFLEIVLPFLYFGTVWTYAKSFFKGIKAAESLRSPFLGTTIIIHILYILLRTIEYHHLPITSVFEIFSLIAFTITLSYLYIEVRSQNRTTGYFILTLPFFFQLISSIFIREKQNIPPMLENNLLGIHVSSAILGITAITISAVYGLLYLMLYHDIKSSQFSVIYKRLPNLEALERMSFNATIFGFVLLTIAIVVGLVWLPSSVPNFSYTDPKLFGTFAIWLIYAAGFGARTIAGWHGRKVIVLSMVGFVLAIFSMTVINVLFSSFHRFY